MKCRECPDYWECCTSDLRKRRHHCGKANSKPTKTNANRIRSMTDEELAMKLSEIEYSAVMSDKAWHPAKWLDWLRQEVE